jgi:hypothetical protein
MCFGVRRKVRGAGNEKLRVKSEKLKVGFYSENAHCWRKFLELCF